MANLIVSAVGTKDFQCKHMSFKNVFDFEDYCMIHAPKKAKQIQDFIDAEDLCSIMSDCFVTYHCEWSK